LIAFGVKYVKSYCDGTLDQTKLNPQFTKILDDVRIFEADLAATPSKYLCTEQCPCPPSTSSDNWLSKFTSAGSYDALYASFSARAADTKFKRNFTTTTSLTEYRNALNAGRNTPLLVSATKNYDNFFACYGAVSDLEDAEVLRNPSYQRRIKPVSANFEKFAQDFETSLNCNGICYPGLFFYFKTIRQGPPMKNCIDGLTTLF
jgi:hypothetical protein